MYGLKIGSRVLVIKADQEWYGENFKEHVTRHFNVFDKEDMVIDPIGRLASHRAHLTIGGDFAREGFFGFRKGDWVVLAKASDLEYDGVPLLEA